MRNILLALLIAAGVAQAQLTPEQRALDFRHLAGQYNKNYAPYEWKRTLFGFDLLELRPWLDRIARVNNDLEYYDLLVEYVASLQDTHAAFSLPSNFSASLNIGADLYDNRVLIEGINRARLPLARFPFAIGDEIVSLDGRPVEELLPELVKYAAQGNPLAARRIAAARLTFRPQSRVPRAPELGESATVVIRRQSGDLETYTLPWTRTGTPLQAGPVESPRAGKQPSARLAQDDEPDYMAPLREAQQSAAIDPQAGPEGLLNYGGRFPIFLGGLPNDFSVRLGLRANDFFFSGTYTTDGKRIGFIRIPSYSPPSTPLAVQQFAQEIAFFQANTDGLIIDQMRNPGGLLCFGETLASLLIPYDFRPIGYELRPAWWRVVSFSNALTSARANNADGWVIVMYEALLRDITQAYREGRGQTGSIPLCSPLLDRPPARDAAGNLLAYTKPLVMLVDEFSTSTGDSVPAMIQDARRGPLYGLRTNGAGGTNISVAGGAYSEGSMGMTLGLMTRAQLRPVEGYPTSHYIESVGVRPDIEAVYMTRENLLQAGKPYVGAFTAALLEEIRRVNAGE